MKLLSKFFSFIGIWGTKEDHELSEKIKKSYKSIKVVGRGTITVDANEVQQDLIDNNVYEQAKKLVEGQ